MYRRADMQRKEQHLPIRAEKKKHDFEKTQFLTMVLVRGLTLLHFGQQARFTCSSVESITVFLIL